MKKQKQFSIERLRKVKNNDKVVQNMTTMYSHISCKIYNIERHRMLSTDISLNVTEIKRSHYCVK